MNCAIWGTPATEAPTRGDYRDITSARAGGRYSISGPAEMDVQRLDSRAKAMLTTWIVNHLRSGEERPRITTDVIDRIADQLPLRFGARIDRFFEFMAGKVNKIGESYVILEEEAPTPFGDELTAWLECVDSHEMLSVLRFLKDQKYLVDERFFRTGYC
jgi:hypothetical protein